MLQEIWRSRPYLRPSQFTYERTDLDQAGLIELAQYDFSTPWPHTRFSDYADYFQSGTRVNYEAAVSKRLHRLLAGTAAGILGEPGALADVATGIWLLCEQTTWCWPAHEEFGGEPRRGVTPFLTSPTIDLGAGEVVSALAWALGWLQPELDEQYPGLTDRVKAEAWERIFAPFIARDDWHWQIRLHNWNPWIHANIITAATVLAPADQQERILDKCIAGISRFAEAIPADGAIDEGWEYWWNGVGRMLDALEILERIGGVNFDQLAILPATLTFVYRCALAYDPLLERTWYASFSDSRPLSLEPLPWALLARWTRRLGLADVASFAQEQDLEFWHHNAQNAGLITSHSSGQPQYFTRHFLGATRVYGALATPNFPFTHQQSAAEMPALAPQVRTPLPPRTQFSSLDLTITRSIGTGSLPASAGFAAAGKGGHNAENHNHLDLGSVMVFYDGQPVLVDVGRAIYTAQTFGPDRYELWYTNSAWHSTVHPRGLRQLEGSNWRGELQPSTGECGDRWDLSRAYELDDDESWHRELLVREGDPAVIITDTWQLAPGETTFTFMVWGIPTPVAGGRGFELSRPDGSVIDFEFSGITTSGIEISKPPQLDSMLAMSWQDHVHRVQLKVTHDSSAVHRSQVVITPVNARAES